MIDALTAIQCYPAPAPAPRKPPAPATDLRRFDVVDSDMRLVLSGSTPGNVRETAGETLAPEIAAELAHVVRTHDFGKRPVATALAGTQFAMRVSRSVGPAGSFYHVFTERTMLGRMLERVAGLYRLGESETELLRLLVGGYELGSIAERIGVATTALSHKIRMLERKLNCVGRQALASIVYASPFPLKNAH